MSVTLIRRRRSEMRSGTYAGRRETVPSTPVGLFLRLLKPFESLLNHFHRLSKHFFPLLVHSLCLLKLFLQLPNFFHRPFKLFPPFAAELPRLLGFLVCESPGLLARKTRFLERGIERLRRRHGAGRELRDGAVGGKIEAEWKLTAARSLKVCCWKDAEEDVGVGYIWRADGFFGRWGDGFLGRRGDGFLGRW